MSASCFFGLPLNLGVAFALVAVALVGGEVVVVADRGTDDDDDGGGGELAPKPVLSPNMEGNSSSLSSSAMSTRKSPSASRGLSAECKSSAVATQSPRIKQRSS